MEVSKAKPDQANGVARKDHKEVRESSSASKLKNLSEIQKNSESVEIKKPTQEVVSWSEDATMYSQGIDAVKTSPDLRPDKVAQIKAAIKNGTYKIDNKAIAEKMLQAVEEEADRKA